MSANAAPLDKLIDNFARLPGIGRKSAARMAYQVIAMPKNEAIEFARAIEEAHTKLRRCKVCQSFTDVDVCDICSGITRDKTMICVVESPRDVTAFERTREFKGLYHVLHGLISPMDGISAEQLTVRELIARLNADEVKEVIMATSPTVEGDATAIYLAKLIKPIGAKVSRLAYGLPVGGSLEYADSTTLGRSLISRGEL